MVQGMMAVGDLYPEECLTSAGGSADWLPVANQAKGASGLMSTDPRTAQELSLQSPLLATRYSWEVTNCANQF